MRFLSIWLLCSLLTLGCSTDTTPDPSTETRPNGTLYYNDQNGSLARLDLSTGAHQVLFTGNFPYATKEGSIVCRAKGNMIETSDFLTTRLIVAFANGPDQFTKDFRDPQVSPDGTLIAYQGLFDDIYVVKRTDGSLVASFDPEGVSAAYRRPSWTSDGRIVCAGGSTNPGLYISDAGLTTMTRFDLGLALPKLPHVDRITNRVVFSMNNHLYTVSLDGTNVTQLTSTNTYDQVYPTWSPDGKWIAFYEVQKFLVIPSSGGTAFDIRANYPTAPGHATDQQFSWKQN